MRIFNKKRSRFYLDRPGLPRKQRLTQRAPDKWDSARFLRVFNASAGFRFRACSASRPLAGNANRWAAP